MNLVLKHFLLRQLVLSIVFIALAMLIYELLAYFIDLPGRGTIEEKYMTEDDKKKKKKTGRLIRKIYILVLILIVAIFNIVTYYAMKG